MSLKKVGNDPEASMSPQEWLESIRRRYGYDREFYWPEHKMEAFLARLPLEEREAARAVWRARFGRRISDIHDDLIAQYLDRIRPVLNSDEQQALDDAYFGVFPTGEFNAWAGYTPKGDRVVILHEGLPHTLAISAHWYLRLWEEGGLRYLSQNADSHLHTLQYLVRVWYGQLDPDMVLPDIYPKSRDGWGLSEELALAAIAFVLGHEIGHITHRHSDYSDDAAKNHQQEHQADRAGLRLVLRYSLLHSLRRDDTYYLKFMLFAPLFALAVMALVSGSASATHPSASRRCEVLMTALPEEWGHFFGKRSERALAEIDPNLFRILDANSRGLIEVYSTTSEYVRTLQRTYRNAAAVDLRAALFGQRG